MKNTQFINTTSTQKKASPKDRKGCALKVSSFLFSKINDKISILKHLRNYSVSKQEWISEAIKEKLERDSKKIRQIKEIINNSPVQKSASKQITLFIDSTSDKEIDSHLDVLKQVGDPSIPKKSWIIEAIKEKLSKEK